MLADVDHKVSWAKVWVARMALELDPPSRGFPGFGEWCDHGSQLCQLCDCLSLYEDSLLHNLLVHHVHLLGLGDIRSVEGITASVVELRLLKFSNLFDCL